MMAVNSWSLSFSITFRYRYLWTYRHKTNKFKLFLHKNCPTILKPNLIHATIASLSLVHIQNMHKYIGEWKYLFRHYDVMMTGEGHCCRLCFSAAISSYNNTPTFLSTCRTSEARNQTVLHYETRN